MNTRFVIVRSTLAVSLVLDSFPSSINLHQQHIFFGRERVKMTYVWKLTTQGSLGHPARIAPAHLVVGVGGVAVGVGVCAQVTGQTRVAHVACHRSRTCKMYTLQRQRPHLKTQTWSQNLHFAATKVASQNTDLISKCTLCSDKSRIWKHRSVAKKSAFCNEKGYSWKHRLVSPKAHFAGTKSQLDTDPPKVHFSRQKGSNGKHRFISPKVHFAATKVAAENTDLTPKCAVCSDKNHRHWHSTLLTTYPGARV